MPTPPPIEPEPMEPNSPAPRCLPLRDLLGEWEETAAKLHEAKKTGVPIGPVSGFPTLDRELCGAFLPGLHVIHGEPGAGKTAFALQTACDCRAAAVFVSCEMGALELLRRITARVTGTYLGRFKTGELSPAESLALAKRACEETPSLLLVDATDAPAAASHIEAAAAAWKERTESEHALIVVDSIHSWAESVCHEAEEYSAVNASLLALRRIAKRLNCPVLGIAERNRASMTKGGLSASSSSRKFEFGPETVLGLGRARDKSGEPKPEAAGWIPVDLVIEKNRNGAKGRTAKLEFHGAQQEFRERRA